MKANKVLFITQEIIPYVEDSEMAQQGKMLPTKAQEDGREVRIFMPKWGNVNERRNQLHEVIRLSGMNMIINDTDHPLLIKVASMQSTRMQVYFIDNDDYFMKRLMAQDKEGAEYTDNAERAIFYARGVLETVKKLRWCPDVIVCQGWMGLMAAFYVKNMYKDEPSFRDSKVVLMVEAQELEHTYSADFLECMSYRNLEPEVKELIRRESYSYHDLLNIAINNADGVIIGSPMINEETKTLIANSGILVKNYPEDSEKFYECCNNFYDEVFSLDKNE